MRRIMFLNETNKKLITFSTVFKIAGYYIQC